MSEAENPSLARAEGSVKVSDIHRLVAAATPHFALQVRNRIEKLTRSLPDDSPVRAEAERQIEKLEALARSGETRGVPAQDGQEPLESVAGLRSDTEVPQ